jgi:hypothetical protein
MEGRFARAIDDVKAVALPALRHRVLLNFEGEAEGVKTDAVLEEILKICPSRGRSRPVGWLDWLRARPPAALAQAIREEEGRRALRRRVPAQARLPRGGRGASSRAHAGRAAHQEDGLGVEFADHRDYTPGDDLRYLDWHVYQRFERLLVKLYEEEEDLTDLLHPRQLRVDGLRRRREAPTTPSALRGAGLRVARQPRPGAIVAATDEISGRMPDDPRQGRIFKVFASCEGH